MPTGKFTSTKIGDRFRKLIVLELKNTIVSNRQRLYAHCICDCGRYKWIRNDALVRGQTETCGLCECGDWNRKFQLATYKRFYSEHRHAAKLRNFNPLPYEEWEMIVKNPCDYCGGFDIKNHAKWSRVPHKMTPEIFKRYEVKLVGIDRHNNDLGYTLNNSVPCCKTCNKLKGTSTHEEFLSKIKKIYEWKNL